MAATLLNHEEIADLGMTLRDAGYAVGADQCIAVQRLMLTLAAEGVSFRDRHALRTWLAPIFCGSPVEQARFTIHYEAWLMRHGEPDAESNAAPEAADATAPLVGSARTVKPASALRRTIALILLAAIGLGLAFGAYETDRELILRTAHVVVVDPGGARLPGATVLFKGAAAKPSSNGEFSVRFRLLDLPAPVVATNEGYQSSAELNDSNCTQPIFVSVGVQQAAFEPQNLTSPTRLDLTAQEIETLTKSISSALVSPITQTPTSGVAEKFFRRHYQLISIGCVAAPLVLLGLWLLWVRLPRLQLIRWKTQSDIRLDTLRVKDSGGEFFTNPGFRRIVQQLRRHRLVPTADLDADRTVHESAQRAGWFTPVYLWRRRLPDYLILIDRAGFRDFKSRLVEDFVLNLRAGRVEVDCYDFYSDPRFFSKSNLRLPAARRQLVVGNGDALSTRAARAADGSEHTRYSIEDLVARHPTHNVFLFTDGDGFFSPLSGKLQPWTAQFAGWSFRAVLAPEQAERSGARVRTLQEAGFLILSATEKGLSTAVEILDGAEPRLTDVSQRDRPFTVAAYPALLREDGLRWLSDLAPEPSQLSLLIAQLRAYLGREGFVWLCACAAYPELLWDLTLYLGRALKLQGPDERRMAQLLTFPWFRHGSMPDWLRERLIEIMPATERESVRQALWHLLETALEQPLDGFDLSYSVEKGAKKSKDGIKRRWMRRILANFLRTEPGSSALRDAVFVSVLHGYKPGKGVPLPEGLRRLLGHYGQAKRPWLQATLAVLASTAICTVMYYYRPLPTKPPETGIQPLPTPTGPAPYHLNLGTILSADALKTTQAQGSLAFETVGETAALTGYAQPGSVPDAMSQKYAAQELDGSAFAYLLGNVVSGGQAKDLYVQFYGPFRNYSRPIFAIAGNRDSASPPGPHALDVFMRNFCSPRAVLLPETAGISRTAMTQPNIYWTLDTPYATIIGLYTNVTAKGYIDETQKTWLISELKSAPARKALIVAMHDSIYPFAEQDQGASYLSGVLDQAMVASGRAPDVVLSAGYRSYQRISRQLGPGGRTITYVIAGTGGGGAPVGGIIPAVPMKLRASGSSDETVTLEQYNTNPSGFLRVSVSASELTGQFFTVNSSNVAGPLDADSFTIRLNATETAALSPRHLEGFYVYQASPTISSLLKFSSNGSVEGGSYAVTTQKDLFLAMQKWGSVAPGLHGLGKYSVDGSNIKFSTTSQGGTVVYQGAIQGDTLSLNLFSHINNYRGHEIYRYLAPLSMENDSRTVSPAGVPQQNGLSNASPANRNSSGPSNLNSAKSNPNAPRTTAVPAIGKANRGTQANAEAPRTDAVQQFVGSLHTSDGKPLAGIYVMLDDVINSTDANGHFSVELPSRDRPGDTIDYMVDADKETKAKIPEISFPISGTIVVPRDPSQPFNLTVAVRSTSTDQPQIANSPAQSAKSTNAGSVVFNNWNTDAVSNEPLAQTTFTLSRPYYVTRIVTYHWNEGKGASLNGRNLELANRVKNFGGWPMSATAGQPITLKVDWECSPNIILPAGLYVVYDPDPKTWSTNSRSKDAGFVRVEGYPVNESNSVPNAVRP